MKVLLTKTQILAFLAPYINVGSGLIAAWLFVHLHVLGVFHVTQSQAAQVIAGGIVFGITALVTWLSHHAHWLPLAKMALAAQERAVHISASERAVSGSSGAWLGSSGTSFSGTMNRPYDQTKDPEEEKPLAKDPEPQPEPVKPRPRSRPASRPVSEPAPIKPPQQDKPGAK